MDDMILVARMPESTENVKCNFCDEQIPNGTAEEIAERHPCSRQENGYNVFSYTEVAQS